MVDLKTAAVVVGAGAAGLIILSRTDAAPQLGIKMPDISMPDIGIALPSMEGIFEPFKNMFEGLKIPEFPTIPDWPDVTEPVKIITDAGGEWVQILIDKIPTVDEIGDAVGDAVSKATPEFLKDPVGYGTTKAKEFLDPIRDSVQGELKDWPIIGGFYEAPSWIESELERAKDAVPTEPITYAVDKIRTWAQTLDPRR